MAEETLKAKLDALLKKAIEEQKAFIAGLSDAQTAQVGTSEKWSAKDNLTHIVFWQGTFVQQVQMLENGQTPPKLLDDDPQNEINFQAHRAQSWPDVIAAAEDSYSGLFALLESHSEAELTAEKRLPPPRSNPLWRYFLDTGFVHPLTHYADFYMEHGDMARATTLQQQIATYTANLGGEDTRALADYNLACFYAKTGQKDSALALLPNALKTLPSLVDWSKQDPDLVSLHNEPAYQALYA